MNWDRMVAWFAVSYKNRCDTTSHHQRTLTKILLDPSVSLAPSNSIKNSYLKSNQRNQPDRKMPCVALPQNGDKPKLQEEKKTIKANWPTCWVNTEFYVKTYSK